MKIIKIAIICALLSACATRPVYVPVVAKCPIPSAPPKLYYPVADLKRGDSPPVVMKAYVSSLTMCIGQNEYMRKKLEAVR